MLGYSPQLLPPSLEVGMEPICQQRGCTRPVVSLFNWLYQRVAMLGSIGSFL